MKILITGTGGFLGSASVRRLTADGFDVIATARREAANVVGCDLSDPAAVQHLLDGVAPDAVVNCAAVADFSAGSLRRQYAVNVLAPGVMAAWSAAHDAFMVQASATLVHGAGAEFIGPATPLDIDTDYGKAKLLAEELIHASGCGHVLLRFCGLYGTGGPSHLGLNRAIDSARAGERPTVVASGAARRNYLPVDDAAAMISHCLQNGLSGTHLAAGGETLSFADMMARICDRFLPGQKPIQRDGSEAADQIVESSPDLPKARPMAQVLAEMS